MNFGRDEAATQDKFYLDPRSYVSFAGHEYLVGPDVSERRKEVHRRAGGRCWKCGEMIPLAYGHMDHIQGGLGAQRCFCYHNLRWSCENDHTGAEGRHVKVGGRNEVGRAY